MKTSIERARWTRHAAIITMISAVAAVQACSSDTLPTAPASVTSEPVAEVRILRISGTVTDNDGAPVSGVAVRIFRWVSAPEPISAVVTDEKGFYSTSFSASAGISIFTSKEGFTSAWHSQRIENGADIRWDLRIYRAVSPAGNQ